MRNRSDLLIPWNLEILYNFARPNEKDRLMSSYTKAIEQFTARMRASGRRPFVRFKTGSPHAKREFSIDLPIL
jgi:hypothetical protein